MPLISDADAIYRGTTPVDAVYAGDVKVWPTYTEWDVEFYDPTLQWRNADEYTFAHRNFGRQINIDLRNRDRVSTREGNDLASLTWNNQFFNVVSVGQRMMLMLWDDEVPGNFGGEPVVLIGEITGLLTFTSEIRVDATSEVYVNGQPSSWSGGFTGYYGKIRFAW